MGNQKPHDKPNVFKLHLQLKKPGLSRSCRKTELLERLQNHQKDPGQSPPLDEDNSPVILAKRIKLRHEAEVTGTLQHVRTDLTYALKS